MNAKLQYFEKTENGEQQEFLHDHNHCVLCGTPLELRHIRLVESEEIKEEAFCTECDMRTRSKTHTMN